jgi:hypothetical protein
MKLMGQISPGAKNPIKINGWNHHREDRREGQRKAKRHTAHRNQRREQVPLVVGGYLTHSPSNVTCMQLVKSNNNRRSRFHLVKLHI